MTKFNITTQMKKNGVAFFLDKKECVLLAFDIKFDIPDDDFIFIFNEYVFNKDKKIIKFVKKTKKLFKINNYLNYKEYRKNNSFDMSSEKLIRIMYGEVNEVLIQEHRPKKRSIYDPNYVLKKYNLSNIQEAVEWINNYKKSKATTKENFIKKHGNEIGLQKFSNFQKTSSYAKSKERYKEIFGDSWEEQWTIDMKLSSRLSKEFWMVKHGKTEQEAIKIISDIQNNNAGVNINYYLNKGIPEEEAKQIMQKIWKKKGLDKEKFISRYGEEKWETLIYNKSLFRKKGKYVGRVASKESMKIFRPFYKWLRLNNLVNKEDVRIGTSKRVEFSIKNHEGKHYFYDFCDLKNKIIIEYNGEHVHPNIEKLKKDNKLYEWKHVFNNKTAEEMDEIYKIKYKTATDSGFRVLQLWSSDSIKYNLTKCKEFFNENKENRD